MGSRSRAYLRCHTAFATDTPPPYAIRYDTRAFTFQRRHFVYAVHALALALLRHFSPLSRRCQDTDDATILPIRHDKMTPLLMPPFDATRFKFFFAAAAPAIAPPMPLFITPCLSSFFADTLRAALR